MNEFENKLVLILNDWYNELEPVEESDYVKFTFSKKKFKKMYLQKTGEFLNISQRTETVYFNKIAHNLSQNYTFTEELLDEFLVWCFTNYDYLIHKFKGFNLNSITALSKTWDKELFSFEDENVKKTLKDLKHINVSDNVFDCFEIYGIPLCATKLAREKNISKTQLETIVINKLRALTNKNDDLSRLKNMLRMTVENCPYSSEIVLRDYKNKLSEFFVYFSGEIWAK